MSDKMNVAELFGQNVFNDKIMRERLPKKVYKELHKTIDDGKELDPMTAEVVAGQGRKRTSGVFRKRADQGRARCLFFPVRRSACYFRSQGVYSLGLYLPGIC